MWLKKLVANTDTILGISNVAKAYGILLSPSSIPVHLVGTATIKLSVDRCWRKKKTRKGSWPPSFKVNHSSAPVIFRGLSEAYRGLTVHVYFTNDNMILK